MPAPTKYPFTVTVKGVGSYPAIAETQWEAIEIIYGKIGYKFPDRSKYTARKRRV